jgi:glycosyltransferase involved in cell wall biosynthesis
MHIGINAQLLSYSQNYRNGGVSRYIRYLLEGLAEQPGEHEYTVFVNGQDVADRLARNSHITYMPAPWPESRPAARVAWEQLTLPGLIRQKGIEVLHSPVNVLPVRLPRQCAGVVTLHDLAFLRYPEVLTRPKRLYHHQFTVRSIRRAAMVISVSESTREDAVKLVGVPAGRVQVAYPCIDERFSRQPPLEEVAAFQSARGYVDGYVLYLGTLEPRKNITTLIDAYALLRNMYGRREKLVLAGGKGWLYEAIFARVKELGLEEEIIFPGFVSDNEQVLWYSAAAAFVYPSLYEGFGIPVAEALACGTPVVTSNVSSLPEAGMGVALTVEPRDAEALAAAMYMALTDEQLQAKTRQMARAVAQRFSAHAMAAQTVAIYEEAAAGSTAHRYTIAIR